MNEIELIAWSAAAGAGLAATDAASISRMALEATRKKLGVDALAIYDRKAFANLKRREAEQEIVEDASADAGGTDGED